LVKNKVKPTPAPRASQNYSIPPTSAKVLTVNAQRRSKNMPPTPETGIMFGASWAPRTKGGQIKPKTLQIYDDFERCEENRKPWRTPQMRQKHGVSDSNLQNHHDRWLKLKGSKAD
jgi:hypothetical protein